MKALPSTRISVEPQVSPIQCTRPATARGMCRRSRALSSIAGSVASEDWVLAATTCTGSAALAKASGERPANSATSR